MRKCARELIGKPRPLAVTNDALQVSVGSVQFSSVQFISVQFISVQFSSVQFSSVHFSSFQFKFISVYGVLSSYFDLYIQITVQFLRAHGVNVHLRGFFDSVRVMCWCN